MKVLVAGAGPAGLYFSYLLKRSDPGCEIRVVEQNPPDATFGFGVVFSDRALEFLQADDPTAYARITPQLEAWVDLVVVHRGVRTVIDGIGFAAIGRLHFLRLMQEQAATVGVVPEFNTPVGDISGYDLVVAADGANSFVRRQHGADFGTRARSLTNYLAWYGVGRPLVPNGLSFRHFNGGVYVGHYYAYTKSMSTFVAECDAATWQRAGFERMDEPATLAYLENVFSATLQGERLVSNKSIWRNFPNVRNERWAVGNVVLIGDALRTAHFSIGSGTRLAMEDAIALVKALREEPGIDRALKNFEAARRPIVDKLVAAADASGAWYDRFAEHMKLSPRDFAWSYIQRSGRVDPERLSRISPKFART